VARVLVAGFPPRSREDAERLHRVADEVLSAHDLVRVDVGELDVALPDADALVCLLTLRVDDALLARAPKLRVVGNVAVGVDNIDLDACRARGVAVVNTPDVLTRATAELALALLLAAARRTGEGERLVRAGAWDGWAPDQLLGLQLLGRRALIVGPGRIGAETQRLFEGVGLVCERLTRGAGDAEIDAALSRAQVLSLHVPLSDETRGWLSRERIARLPRDAIVLNTARGPIVDERALAEALADRRIFAAGLDVYEQEPAVHEGLLALDNVVLLPHLGSATREAREGMVRLSTSGVAAILAGDDPPNRVA
jgi:glyoxylate reductase